MAGGPPPRCAATAVALNRTAHIGAAPTRPPPACRHPAPPRPRARPPWPPPVQPGAPHGDPPTARPPASLPPSSTCPAIGEAGVGWSMGRGRLFGRSASGRPLPGPGRADRVDAPPIRFPALVVARPSGWPPTPCAPCSPLRPPRSCWPSWRGPAAAAWLRTTARPTTRSRPRRRASTPPAPTRGACVGTSGWQSWPPPTRA